MEEYYVLVQVYEGLDEAMLVKFNKKQFDSDLCKQIVKEYFDQSEYDFDYFIQEFYPSIDVERVFIDHEIYI